MLGCACSSVTRNRVICSKQVQDRWLSMFRLLLARTCGRLILLASKKSPHWSGMSIAIWCWFHWSATSSFLTASWLESGNVLQCLCCSWSLTPLFLFALRICFLECWLVPFLVGIVTFIVGNQAFLQGEALAAINACVERPGGWQTPAALSCREKKVVHYNAAEPHLTISAHACIYMHARL